MPTLSPSPEHALPASCSLSSGDCWRSVYRLSSRKDSQPGLLTPGLFRTQALLAGHGLRSVSGRCLPFLRCARRISCWQGSNRLVSKRICRCWRWFFSSWRAPDAGYGWIR